MATACLGGALAQLPGARLTLGGRPRWSLVPLTLRGEAASALSPSHRRSCQAVSLLALVGLYARAPPRLVRRGICSKTPSSTSSASWRVNGSCRVGLFVVTTALVPIGVLALGLLRRRRAIILLGAVLVAASLVTLRFYVHMAPLWLVLSASGATLILLALGLRRWLDAGTGRERGGFTAERLAGEEQSLQDPGDGGGRRGGESGDARPSRERRAALRGRRWALRRRRRVGEVLTSRGRAIARARRIRPTSAREVPGELSARRVKITL